MTPATETPVLRRALDQVEASVSSLGGVCAGQADALRRAADLTQLLAETLADAARAGAELARHLDQAAALADAQLGLARQTIDLLASASRLAPATETRPVPELAKADPW